MKIDIHITTCHHSTVKCRDRVGLPPGSNIRSWTKEERLKISQISVESIKNFVNYSLNKNQLKNFTLIDDGSDLIEAKDWLKTIKKINVLSFPHRGSSAALNDYQTSIDAEFVLHIEDDHILFNPKKINIIEIFDKVLNSKFAIENNIKVITFRSGLPSDINSPGINGAWAPKGFIKINDIPCIIYNRLGNAHHVMAKETYSNFFPLKGNTGGCEAFMNSIMESKNYKNVEIQLPIYAFHSHTLNYSIDKFDTDSWNKSGDGFEYGIYDMDKFLRSKTPISCTYYNSYPNDKKVEILKDYCYD